MEQFRTTLGEFLRDLRAQKLRTALTVFGIMWGTVAIVVLLAFGMGFKRQLSISMHGIGESIGIMFPASTSKPFEGFGIGRPIRLTEDDAWLMRDQVAELKAVCPEYMMYELKLRNGENIINGPATGIYPVYADMRNIIPEAGGRFINDLDIADRRRVALIGNEVKRLLYGESEAIGKAIYVNEVPFTVVGVMQKKTQNSSYNYRDQDRVFIPATTFTSIYGATYVNNIIFQVHDAQQSESAIEHVREVLGRKHRFDPKDTDAIWIWDTTMFDRFIGTFFFAFNIFMGVIGGFTLAVGGIGVANIMYIVVQERTREIGVKRAVGATRGNIMVQFLAETFLIIGLGSVLGFLIAVGITAGMQYIPIKEFVGTPIISVEVGVITCLVLSLIGFAAGFFPARRAANLNVVDCLRT